MEQVEFQVCETKFYKGECDDDNDESEGVDCWFLSLPDQILSQSKWTLQFRPYRVDPIEYSNITLLPDPKPLVAWFFQIQDPIKKSYLEGTAADISIIVCHSSPVIFAFCLSLS